MYECIYKESVLKLNFIQRVYFEMVCIKIKTLQSLKKISNDITAEKFAKRVDNFLNLNDYEHFYLYNEIYNF